LYAAARGVEDHPHIRQIVEAHRARLLRWRAEELAALHSKLLAVIARLN
jgi:hypothetical protein